MSTKSATPSVLHLPTSIDAGGAEQVVIELVSRARARGEPQRIIALRGTRAESALSEGLAEQVQGPQARHLDELRRGDAFRLARYVRRALEPGEIVHAHLPWPDALGATLLARRRAPLLVTFHLLPSHDILGLGDVALAPFLDLRQAAQLAARFAPLVFTAVSEQDAERLRLTFPGVRVERVYNSATTPRGPAPAPLPFGPGIKLFAVGRLSQRKGFDRVLRALAREPVRDLAFSLCIAGEGEAREQLVGLAAELGLAQKVRFVGQVAATHLYQQADLFISGSRAEGLPLVLLEAMGAGVAVAVSDIPAHREVVGSLPEALLDADESRWPAQLARLFTDGPLRQSLAQKALQRSEACFSARAQDEAFASLYLELAGLGQR